MTAIPSEAGLLTPDEGVSGSRSISIAVPSESPLPFGADDDESVQLISRHGAGRGSNGTPTRSAGTVAHSERDGRVVDANRHQLAVAPPEDGLSSSAARATDAVLSDLDEGGLPRSGTRMCAAPVVSSPPPNGLGAGRSTTATQESFVGPGLSISDAHSGRAGAGAMPTAGAGRRTCARRRSIPARPGTDPNDGGGRNDSDARDAGALAVACPDQRGGGQGVVDAQASLVAPTFPDDGLSSRAAQRGGAVVGLTEVEPGQDTYATPTTAAGLDRHTSLCRRTQTAELDIDLLHATLGHYSRMLLDVQKVRTGMENRAGAIERDGLPEEWSAPARAVVEELARTEKGLNRYLEQQAKRHPMAAWVKQQKGIGLPGFARLIGITGPLDRFATVSKLWRYLGLAVIGGEAERKQKGVKLSYSPQGKVLCFQLGESIVKTGKGGEYRAVYDDKRAAYFARERTGPSGCPTGRVHKTKTGAIVACVKADESGKETSAHIHAMARRFAVKRLLRRAWTEWRRMQREAADAP